MAEEAFARQRRIPLSREVIAVVGNVKSLIQDRLTSLLGYEPDIQAALGLALIEKVDFHLAQRRKIADWNIPASRGPSGQDRLTHRRILGAPRLLDVQYCP